MNIVEINPDVVDIGEINIPEFKLSEGADDDIDLDLGLNETISSKPSVNFGSGIELLMNEKNRNEKKGSTGIEIEDITNLENELNNLADDTKQVENVPSSSKKTIFGSMLGLDSSKKDGANIKPVTENINAKPNLGKSTSEMNENKTWDGFGKFNNVPVNLEKTAEKPELTKEETLKEKFKYLKKLEDLERKGANLTQRYNMDSDLQEMMGEYEMIIAEKERSNSVKFQGKMLMACITGIEFLNNKFDPFDIKLDGFGEQVNENIDEYDTIFEELHEKYKSKAKMSPELKLLFQLGGSAMMVHMSNTLFKSSMPGMDDIMKQNPELMKQFTQAAVNTMGESNPGFGGFMNNIFSGQQTNPNNANRRSGNMPAPGFGPSHPDPPPNINTGPPPPPVETQLPERSRRVPNIPNRPDLMGARGTSIDQNEGNPTEEPRITRPEMKGPSSKQEINSLLSGLKTKQINVNEPKDRNEVSTISVDDLKELAGAKIPRSKRKQKSDQNIVSLDI